MLPQIATIPFDTGPSASTTVTELPGNLSRYDALILRVSCTKADTDAGDILDVALQSSYDGTVWDDRARMQFLGNLSPSASAPEEQQAVVQKWGTLSDTEEVHEPSGSAGGSRLTVGTVRNGPFPGLRRDATGRLASWRLVVEVTDADADADFEGTIAVYGDFNDR